MSQAPEGYIPLDEQAERLGLHSSILRGWIRRNKVAPNSVLKIRSTIYVKEDIAFFCNYQKCLVNGYTHAKLIPEGYVSVAEWAAARSIPLWQALDWIVEGLFPQESWHVRGIVRYLHKDTKPPVELAIALCTLILLAITPANAQVAPFHGENVLSEPVTIHGELKPKEHYVGLGWERSKHLALFPIKHPVLAFHKGTYPLRHPCKAFAKFGEICEPYQSGLNVLSSLSGPATTAGVFIKGGI